MMIMAMMMLEMMIGVCGGQNWVVVGALDLGQFQTNQSGNGGDDNNGDYDDNDDDDKLCLWWTGLGGAGSRRSWSV